MLLWHKKELSKLTYFKEDLVAQLLQTYESYASQRKWRDQNLQRFKRPWKIQICHGTKSPKSPKSVTQPKPKNAMDQTHTKEPKKTNSSFGSAED